MGSSRMITLFAEPPRPEPLSFTLVLSIALHASTIGLFTYQALHAHRIVERFSPDRYALRILEFHSAPPQVHPSPAESIPYPAHAKSTPAKSPKIPRSVAKVAKSVPQESAPGSASIMRRTPRLLPAPQTLIQPDIARNITLPDKTPVPLVILWSPDKSPAPQVHPPLPDKPAVAPVQASLDPPNAEEKLADLKIAATASVSQLPAPPPSTTSPITVHGPEETKRVPETTSNQPDPPAPARVISLSDVRVPEGKVAVPQANTAQAKAPVGAAVPGVLRDKDPATSGNGTGVGKGANSQAGKGASGTSGTSAANALGDHSSTKADHPATAATQAHGSASAAAAKVPAPTQVAAAGVAGAPPNPASGKSPSTVHISLPKDGEFGVVVVGASVIDKYPETAELWSGRLASTVYLHVGLAKSWILQYALPRLAGAATAGGHLEAPWPFEIVRPNLNFDNLDSDALILHGFVNKDGRFEKLQVVFPPEFLQASMVANAIGEWQFRPARQNGQFTPVEVLLIIPQDVD